MRFSRSEQQSVGRAVSIAPKMCSSIGSIIVQSIGFFYKPQQGILKALLLGLIDSLKGSMALYCIDKSIKERADERSALNETKKNQKQNTTAQKSKKQEPKIVRRTFQCCLLNGGVFGVSIWLFNYLLLPVVEVVVLFMIPNTGPLVWAWLRPLLMAFFSTIWVLPFFFLTKIINSLWFQDIADTAYRHRRGVPQQFSSVSKTVADTLFSTVVQALFLIQTMLVSRLPIPVLAELLSMVHMCLLYSLYSFEYKWCNMGWELHHRLMYIENNWPYFIGFGLPLSILTNLPESYVYSGILFSVFFPLFIISGTEADPVTNVCDARLKLFSPVVTLSNYVFNKSIGAHKTR